MLTSWRQWCRLCANEHSTIDVFFKNEDSCNIPDLVRRFFQVSIDPSDEAPVTICTTCQQSLHAIARYEERVTKVDAMYASIIHDNINSNDYLSLKYQFGLVKDESPNLLMLKCDVATDTVDLNIEFLSNKNIGSSEAEPVADAVEAKIDPLVHPMEEDATDQKEEKKCLESLSIDYIDDAVEDGGELESDSSDKSDEDYKEKSTKPTTTKKRKGRKRKEPPFSCNKFDKAFLQKTGLRDHKRTAHFKGEKKEFPCQKCDEKFPTLRRAQNHEIVHLDLEQKPAYPCPHCDKSFTKITNLQTHVRTIHVGERPFICEACGKSFAKKGDLKEHNYIHMDETPFQCEKCSKKFKTLTRLKKHEDIHDGTMYVCPNCGLILNTKHTLRTHMVVHSDQKKHKCTICNSEFKRAKSLKSHLILHSGLRPYACPFCDKTFVNGPNCRSHKKKAHPAELAAVEAAGEISRATNLPTLEQLKAS